jgi:uroporphyrinogen III methyltransferase/synthase
VPPGRVYLIGAGPGDPGLISARGLRLLAQSDVVIYDKAVEPVLRWAPADAERIAAGAPAERDTPQDAISMLIAEKARDGHTVARLKWGDPFVFDSGAKEALFLHEQGIAFEVVPGIPPATGATAYAGVPITYPGSGDAVVLLRGYEAESDVTPDVDWEALSRIDGTVACYAGARLVPRVLTALIDHGVEPERPAALIYHGTFPGQRTHTGTIGALRDLAADDGHGQPALLVVGEVASFRDHLRWFDERPLFGRRIVVTRSPDQAGALVDALENLGAQAIEAPTFRLAPPDDPEAIDRAAATVDAFDWVVFESATAVGRFLAALAHGPRDLRALGRVRLCAIGPSTAERLAASGLKADVIVPEVGVDSIGAALDAAGSIAGQRLLIVRPDHLRDTLARELIGRGATVTDLVAYRTEAASADSAAAQRLYRMLLDGQIDAVTFTSPTAVRRFASLVGDEQAADLLNTTVAATIGPVTAAAARELGVDNPLVPDTYTVDGLMTLLVERLGRTG